MQGLEQYFPEAQRLLESFNFIPNWRVDDVMASFAVPGGSVGPHLDNYDVFLVQASGSRKWGLSAGPVQEEQLVPGIDVKILDNYEEGMSVGVGPGDILYLRRNMRTTALQ